MQTDHRTHERHDHQHGANCGHRAINHGDHTDYLHDGHMHRSHDGHVDEHAVDGGESACTSGHSCKGHDEGHRHEAGCGHEKVPHGDHHDYIVGDHLHSAHAGHCDMHGKVQFA